MRRIAVVTLLLALPVSLAAQLPDPSIRSLGMGGAQTASARGWEAVGHNPALLASSGQPGWSLGLPRAHTEFGSNAWGWSDVRRYAGQHLDNADKQELLDQIDSTLDTRSQIGVTAFGLQIGPFGFGIGTAGDVRANVGKDAAELFLFGNAHRSTPFTFPGSRADGWAATTAALSYALSFGRISAGVTVKKVWGHGLGTGRELSSNLQSQPTFDARLIGHAVYTDYPDGYEFSGSIFSSESSPGSGYGVDVGGVWELSGITVAATLVNALANMDWDQSRLTYELADYQVTQDASGSTFDTLITVELHGSQIDTVPVAAALRDSLLARSDFSKVLRGGAAFNLGDLRLAADLQIRLTDGVDRLPSQQVAVGAELMVLGFLPLRAGFGTDFSESVTLSGGTGLHFGPVKIDVGASSTSGDKRNGVRVGAGLGLVF